MNRNDEESSVLLNFLAGVGIGALVGAVTALLVAPKAGTEAREDIKVAVDDLRTRANRMVSDLSTATDPIVQRGKELLDTTMDKLQNAVESGRQVIGQQQEDTTGESTGEQESQA